MAVDYAYFAHKSNAYPALNAAGHIE